MRSDPPTVGVAGTDASYVCPQCGPDPRGPDVHARERHEWPPGVLVPGDQTFSQQTPMNPKAPI